MIMNSELKDILTDILELIERLARGYDEEDVITELKKVWRKIGNLENEEVE